MDQSRRAVEAYWRTRMVDGVTSDEDKVAPVYKLEEVCELLRSSPAGIVKEVSDYVLKRLDHKSPVVKQKALRLIKYAVGKSGNEFKREMQRHSVAMRQLFHYKGQLDPLKGDALNQAVRDTAHEGIAAIFVSEDNKGVTPVQGLNKRIEGFGNTNFEVPSGEKRSFLSEVVDLGSASIKQGLSTIAAAHSSRKNDTGSYKSPNLRRSLTTEVDGRSEYGGNEHQRESWEVSDISKRNSGTWSPGSRVSETTSVANEDTSSSNAEVKTREGRLLETIVTSGGVRLQPTRDALQAFLAEAARLDGVAISRALEIKLQSHLWQVRMKAMCVLESILRKKDDEHFFKIVSYFTENKDSVVKCSELPQASLREKAIKVLSLLDGEQTPGLRGEPSNGKVKPAPVVQMPDLIDTGELDDYGSQDSMEKQHEQCAAKLKPSDSLVDDLFESDSIADLSTTDNQYQNDPFADVSFHVTGDKEQNDLFSGLTVDDKKSDIALNFPEIKNPDLLDIFGANSEQLEEEAGKGRSNVQNLMAGLTLGGMIQENEQPGFLPNSSQPGQMPTNGAMNVNLDLNAMYPQVPMQYGISPNIMFNQGFASQSMNYGTMGAFIAQQQLLLQNLGSLNSGFGHTTGNAVEGSNSFSFPDIFQLSNNPVQSHASVVKSPKAETKAFDFISDHVAAARGSKRVT
ncbi:protein MODIFIED TRANSPORT TO THE VACUOLE 1-like [Musa acuminata AAA Group]|uniref:protein MODIFIED TRANSPORT TO THE VACUOLE 1-like n=1 Tax=Musa acuminata AAA Group TaxID=214697 RepID=UPI0031D78CAD